MKRLEQKFRCRRCGIEVIGTRAEIEKALGEHVITAHDIGGFRMGLVIERVW